MDIVVKERDVVRNEDYNFLRFRMKRLEDVYKNSVDPHVRQAVKEKTLFEICERFPTFYDDYGDAFDSCKMSSLMEIDGLTKAVMGRYSVEPLRPVSASEVKKQLKLKEKALNAFIKGYNEAIQTHDLTYYSQRIDDKLVFLTFQDGEPVAAATQVSQAQRRGESLCHICNRFVRGDEILFVTNSAKTSKNNFASIGQTICSNYESCNKHVEDKNSGPKLIKFLRYKPESNDRER